MFNLAFVSSGSIFANHDFINAPTLASLVTIVVAVIFMFFYSILVSLMIFAVRNDLSRVKLNYYLTEKIRKFALKVFYFYVALALAMILLNAFLVGIGIPTIFIAGLMLIITLLLMFVPQSIVIDETTVYYAIANNLEFLQKKPVQLLVVAATGIIITLALVLVEFVLDSTFLIGNFLSLIIFMVAVVPFLEVMKSKLYMEKFELVKHTDQFD